MAQLSDGAAWLSGSNPARDSSQDNPGVGKKTEQIFPARQQEITSEADSKVYELFPKLHK